MHMWTTCPPTLSTLWWPEHLSRRTWEFLGSFAHPHFRCGLIAHPRSCWKLPYSAVWIKVVNVAIPWSLLFTNILMQYRICEKSPNSKIYNKLLFVCGDEKNQKWVIQTSPYFFYKLDQVSWCKRRQVWQQKNWEKGTFSTVMSWAAHAPNIYGPTWS
jgi:hypothetical protein